jgi:hypothetical protein
MKRFRITLLVFCLLLFWLGFQDLSLQWRNPNPEILTLEQMIKDGASREWVTIEAGYQNIEEAISTTGTLELDALLVPLKRQPDQESVDLLVETRDPELLSLFSEYHFQLESDVDREKFRQAHADRFSSPRRVTGMVIDGMVADANRSKLEELAIKLGFKVSPGILFIAEGKEPNHWRGYIFLGVAILGLLKFFSLLRRDPAPLQQHKSPVS